VEGRKIVAGKRSYGIGTPCRSTSKNWDIKKIARPEKRGVVVKAGGKHGKTKTSRFTTIKRERGSLRGRHKVRQPLHKGGGSVPDSTINPVRRDKETMTTRAGRTSEERVPKTCGEGVRVAEGRLCKKFCGGLVLRIRKEWTIPASKCSARVSFMRGRSAWDLVASEREEENIITRLRDKTNGRKS